MKKQYISTYSYEVHAATFLQRTTIVLDNGGKFGNGRLEAMIYIKNGEITSIITDGYKYLTIEKSGYRSIKAALNILHGNMETMRK